METGLVNFWLRHRLKPSPQVSIQVSRRNVVQRGMWVPWGGIGQRGSLGWFVEDYDMGPQTVDPRLPPALHKSRYWPDYRRCPGGPTKVNSGASFHPRRSLVGSLNFESRTPFYWQAASSEELCWLRWPVVVGPAYGPRVGLWWLGLHNCTTVGVGLTVIVYWEKFITRKIFHIWFLCRDLL